MMMGGIVETNLGVERPQNNVQSVAEQKDTRPDKSVHFQGNPGSGTEILEIPKMTPGPF